MLFLYFIQSYKIVSIYNIAKALTLVITNPRILLVLFIVKFAIISLLSQIVTEKDK